MARAEPRKAKNKSENLMLQYANSRWRYRCEECFDKSIKGVDVALLTGQLKVGYKATPPSG